MPLFSASLLRRLFLFLGLSLSLLPHLKHVYQTHGTFSNTGHSAVNTWQLGVSM